MQSSAETQKGTLAGFRLSVQTAVPKRTRFLSKRGDVVTTRSRRNQTRRTNMYDTDALIDRIRELEATVVAEPAALDSPLSCVLEPQDLLNVSNDGENVLIDITKGDGCGNCEDEVETCVYLSPSDTLKAIGALIYHY